METTNQSTATKNVLITRIFDTPREHVWLAFCEAEYFQRWWGPKGYTCPEASIDFQVGGKCIACMRSPEGKDFWSTCEYREIVPMARIVYTDSFADEDGNPVPASYYGMPGEWADEMLVTLTFEEDNGQTRMTLKHEGLPEDQIEPCKEGWNQSLDKLDEAMRVDDHKQS